MEAATSAARSKMAAVYGLILGIFYMVIATLAFSQVGSVVLFYGIKIGGYVLFLVFLGILAARLKKENGGYISFKEIYGAIFIMVLIAGIMYFIYNFVYMQYIDKQYVFKLKTAMLSWMEKFNTPEESLNKTSQAFDKQIEESKKFNLTNNLLGICSNLLWDSLVGLLIALIVRKEKPEFESQ